ncbi:MAG TPA: type II toxin-antitoxin system VapC family toxin [Dissulfurispiraceae bacterium]|nr:type II toxin-antitoxin system VapC family toxin [Dissulfurispiraceae bacterium]
MILYLSTSSLVKLYFDEDHSTIIRRWVSFAEAVATCRFAYPEVAEALSYRLRVGDITEQTLQSVMNAYADDWKHLVVTDFDEMEAVNLVGTYGVKKLDAMHLSAAKMLRSVRDDTEIVFSSADPALVEVARTEGFMVVEL